MQVKDLGKPARVARTILTRYNLCQFGAWRSPASALAWGARGPGFKSQRPDQKLREIENFAEFLILLLAQALVPPRRGFAILRT